MRNGIFLLLGSNQGDPLNNLLTAKELIARDIGEITKCSSVYRTAAWGNIDQPDFYNQVVEISSAADPGQLLRAVLETEIHMGRQRLEKWGPRIIDIDILFFGELFMETPSLTIPHPAIPQRKFTLAPLAEIAPEFIHPVLQKNIKTLLQECSDPLAVHRLPG